MRQFGLRAEGLGAEGLRSLGRRAFGTRKTVERKRTIHSSKPDLSKQQLQEAEASQEPVNVVLQTTSANKKPANVPDFIINHVAPVHAGSQWIQTKRVSEEAQWGDEALEGPYKQFREEIKGIVPDSRVFTDPLRTLTYGTDASFYRLTPKIVVKVHDEAEMIKLINIARKNKTPITFRAGGTSLSGQAITDSILLKLGHTWRYRKIEDDGKTITVEPGWILGQVNRMLAPYGRKLGPDPSSIESCWIGGVVANNSSGMCCGVAQNTYHTIKDLRMVLHDGTVLDTADKASWASFQQSHAGLIDKVMALSRRVKADEELTALIKKKFSIKCTTGYSINALVDFDEPLEIIKHLMVGSEGTLGFVSRATYNSVPDYHNKGSAFIIFPTVEDASNATWELRKAQCTDAVELFDRRSLYTCENMEYMHHLRGLPETATALLIECRGATKEEMEARFEASKKTIVDSGIMTMSDVEFHTDPAKCSAFWDARRALIPMVGAVRETGTSVLLEDVAVPVQNLAALCNGINDMFVKFGYDDGSAFGHALEGNLHLVFTQGFETEKEVQRYSDMMDYLCNMVVELEGSLKAEHGTGRNVAPYVELEWGPKATEIMWELKGLFDPENLLNPGVVLNKNPNVHRENLKPMPAAHGIVDTCMECGFCESACPSGHVTLTPRQRIVATRELARLDASGTAEDQVKADEMRKLYDYMALDTCAADGMCAEKCPVNINTGRMVKELRAAQIPADSVQQKLANVASSNFQTFMGGVPLLLNTVDQIHALIGTPIMKFGAGLVGPLVGLHWNPYLAKGANPLQPQHMVAELAPHQEKKQVVYFATCVSRSMGPARGDVETASIHEKTMSVLAKAGYEVILPEGIENGCCGLIFDSRGLPKQGQEQASQMEDMLMEASKGGEIPILCDTSPCLMRIKDGFKDQALRKSLYDPTEFVAKYLLDRLEFTNKEDSIAVHVPCSSKKMKIDKYFEQIAQACSEQVIMSPVPCCGMAGDRGLRYPEISGGGTASAVAAPPGAAMVLREGGAKSTTPWTEVKSSCSEGFSSSRTCEISLSNQTGTHFKSIMYLVDRCTKPKVQA